MRDLTLVGVHDDGEHLVLTDDAGQQFWVQVDEPLRAAVRRDRARLGQLQVEAEGLRPKEIQARIRAGQTAEEVAEAACAPIEHIRRFEGPVLAEREFVATQARGVRLRRPGSGMTAFTLGEMVQQRLGQREVDDTNTQWDAWREEDGTWVVCLSFHAGSTHRRAHWTYDTQLRHVAARDDEARWFTEEDRTEIPVPGARRLTPIRDTRDMLDVRNPTRELRDVRDVYDHARETRDHGTDGTQPRPAARYPEDRPGEARYAEDYPEEHYLPDRYENARYGEDRLREDPYREEIYGEDRPAEVRRATIDLLDTLRERRGRRQRLTPAAPAAGRNDAVDVAVEALRTRADALGEPPGSRPSRRREALPDLDLEVPEDPDSLRLSTSDEVIELPDDDEPPRRHSPGAEPGSDAGAGRSTGSGSGSVVPGSDDRARSDRSSTTRTVPGRGGVPQRAAGGAAGTSAGTERSAGGSAGTERSAGSQQRPAAADRPPANDRSGSPKLPSAVERSTSRPGTSGHPATTGKRPTDRRTAERAGEPGQRSTGSRGQNPRTAGPTAGTSPSGRRDTSGRGAGGRRPAPGGYPSPVAPPAPPAPAPPAPASPAPARERQTTGPVEDAGSTERSSTRRNKRASVPSWDDIVFGSRRE
jgi:hypothetical protein